MRHIASVLLLTALTLAHASSDHAHSEESATGVPWNLRKAPSPNGPSSLSHAQSPDPSIYGPDIHLAFSWGYNLAPDCVRRQPLVLVNEMWPPPPIRIKAGKTTTLKVTNKLLSVAVTVHLHGLKMAGTPWADGTGMITTCPIIPGTNSSIQIFKAPTLPGTYLYHGHVGQAKAAGFTGLLIVDPDPESESTAWPKTWAHDGELVLLMGDSYHAPILPALAGLIQQEFRWVGDPQTVLLNGRSYFNCFDNEVYSCPGFDEEVCESGITDFDVCGAGNAVYYNRLVHCDESYCPGRASLHVESGKTYLLRVGNGGISSLLNLAIQGHKLTVVELDGVEIIPKVVSTLDLSPGQRASIILKTNRKPKTYWIDAMTRGRPNVRFGSGFLVYDNKAPSSDMEGQLGELDLSLVALRASHPAAEDNHFTRSQQKGWESPDAAFMPARNEVAKTFSFLNTQERFQEGKHNHFPSTGDELGIGLSSEQQPQCFCNADVGFLKWTAARRTFEEPTTPLLHQLYYGLETRSVKQLEEVGKYELVEGEVYDIVLQNYPACNGVCETHPWHLHGHNFWHVGTWQGKYDPRSGYPSSGGGGDYIRDTILLIGESEVQGLPNANCGVPLEPCGFTVIRFVANNPGAWFFHCHIDWHLSMGMAVTFYYKNTASLVPPPDLSNTAICGDIFPSVVIQHQENQNTD